ncbi:MAG TPA: glycosyltransferase family 4 protein [Verrucomicrobiae bacterium]|nr:glycosyltransferase family 4 protein [Verrucomicrobiae bacterium]
MNPLRLTHYFTHYQAMGGVQSMLRRHLARDAQWKLDSDIVAFFDPPGTSEPRVRGLGFSWRTTTRAARRQFEAVLPKGGGDVAMYHNGWGIPFFADLDGATRRVVLFHSWWPGVEEYVAGLKGLTDGFLCVSEPLRDIVTRYLPELAPARIGVLPVPVSDCPVPTHRTLVSGRPLVIGFNARLVRQQKRVDRLPALLSALDAAKLDYQFELLGDGADEAWLRGQIGSHPRVKFLGRRGGDDYWRVLASWDIIIFTSDYEGLPISLLEALNTGAVPLYPRMNSGGDAYVEQIRPDLLHQQEDFTTVARIVKGLATLSEAGWRELRARSQSAVKGHLGDAYHEKFTKLVLEISALPRLSAARFGPRPFHPADMVPFGILSRFSPRSYLRGAPRLG